MELIDHSGIRLHRWTCGTSTFLARPELGAQLLRWSRRLPNDAEREIIRWPESADFEHPSKVRGGNPILFPFSARSYYAGERGFWKAADGVVRPMPQHGFAREGAFRIVAADGSGFTAELVPDAAAREAYPFAYRFTVRYAFSESSLQVFLCLENQSEIPIQWSAGHHFYFALPWHEGLNRSDYQFRIPATECYRHAPEGNLVPILPLRNEASFGDTGISDLIFTRLDGDQVVFGPKDREESVGVRILPGFETESPWNTFVIWTENKESPFYCVEPWMGPPNGAEHGKGLHTVDVGASATFGVEVALL